MLGAAKPTTLGHTISVLNVTLYGEDLKTCVKYFNAFQMNVRRKAGAIQMDNRREQQRGRIKKYWKEKMRKERSHEKIFHVVNSRPNQ